MFAPQAWGASGPSGPRSRKDIGKPSRPQVRYAWSSIRATIGPVSTPTSGGSRSCASTRAASQPGRTRTSSSTYSRSAEPPWAAAALRAPFRPRAGSSTSTSAPCLAAVACVAASPPSSTTSTPTPCVAACGRIDARATSRYRARRWVGMMTVARGIMAWTSDMILFLHHRYWTTGGDERVVSDLRWLAEELLGELTALMERDSADVGRAAAAAGLIGGGLRPQAVANAVRATGARVVHAHNLNPTLGWRALAAAREAGGPPRPPPHHAQL